MGGVVIVSAAAPVFSLIDSTIDFSWHRVNCSPEMQQTGDEVLELEKIRFCGTPTRYSHTPESWWRGYISQIYKNSPPPHPPKLVTVADYYRVENVRYFFPSWSGRTKIMSLHIISLKIRFNIIIPTIAESSKFSSPFWFTAATLSAFLCHFISFTCLESNARLRLKYLIKQFSWHANSHPYSRGISCIL